jgi:N utilization substance protein A
VELNIQDLKIVAHDKEIGLDVLVEAIEAALLQAYHRTPDAYPHARAAIDRKTGSVTIWAWEEDEDGTRGEEVDVTPHDFGRIAAVTARHVMQQRLREVEEHRLYGDYLGLEGHVVSGVVQQAGHPGTVLVNLGKVEATLPEHERAPGERYPHGTRMRFFVAAVRRGPRGPVVTVSRSHPGLVKGLFELEVPEIGDGAVEITAVAREAGHRTKIAVRSLRAGVNAKGAFIGQMGSRVRAVMAELGEEKIDIVDHSDDPARMVGHALSPAKVERVVVVDEIARAARVYVPDDQLSLAIGKEGQNARLAARLTGWRIDIRPASQAATDGVALGAQDSTGGSAGTRNR